MHFHAFDVMFAVEEEPFPVYYVPGVTPMNPDFKTESLTPISGQVK